MSALSVRAKPKKAREPDGSRAKKGRLRNSTMEIRRNARLSEWRRVWQADACMPVCLYACDLDRGWQLALKRWLHRGQWRVWPARTQDARNECLDSRLRWTRACAGLSGREIAAARPVVRCAGKPGL